jgi:hypothetical protein
MRLRADFIVVRELVSIRGRHHPPVEGGTGTRMLQMTKAITLCHAVEQLATHNLSRCVLNYRAMP